VVVLLLFFVLFVVLVLVLVRVRGRGRGQLLRRCLPGFRQRGDQRVRARRRLPPGAVTTNGASGRPTVGTCTSGRPTVGTCTSGRQPAQPASGRGEKTLTVGSGPPRSQTVVLPRSAPRGTDRPWRLTPDRRRSLLAAAARSPRPGTPRGGLGSGAGSAAGRRSAGRRPRGRRHQASPVADARERCAVAPEAARVKQPLSIPVARPRCEIHDVGASVVTHTEPRVAGSARATPAVCRAAGEAVSVRYPVVISGRTPPCGCRLSVRRWRDDGPAFRRRAERGGSGGEAGLESRRGRWSGGGLHGRGRG